MWYCPPEYNDREYKNLNQEFMKTLVGELDDHQAKLTLVDFLRNNLGWTCEMLTGIKLAPYQEVTLRGLMNRNYSMCVWGRGCGKTFIASMYCIMQAIMEPNSRIIIAGPTFRTSRFIFNKIEEVLGGKKAVMARQAFGEDKRKANDIHYYNLPNNSSIAAIPLNGEKIRGFRANILVIDEYLLMSREIIDTVLIPFMTAPQDMAERQAIVEKENELIRLGVMKESERHIFEDKTKLIALSSASYTFENLYITYQEWMKKIYTAEDEVKKYDKGKKPPKYFISQMAWDSIPRHMINESIIKEAEGGGTSNAIFQREYCAKFSDGSEGYFSAKKMEACSVPDGEFPVAQVKPNKGAKYILAVDPNASNSPTSDDFAMSLIELWPEKQSGMLVHAYGEHGKDLREHIKYFYYLVTTFNVDMIAIDNAGADTFISACNESRWFRDAKIELKYMDFDPSKDEPENLIEAKTAKREWNKTIHKNVIKIVFSNNDWIRKSNEYLQGCIDMKKIWFASNPKSIESAFDAIINNKIDTDLLTGTLNEDEEKLSSSEGFMMDQYVEHLALKIRETKKQCAMIEVKTSARGTQSFDLPLHLMREKGKNRARRDNYTSLLLGVWCMKLYYEMMSAPEEQIETFNPFWA